MYIRRADQSATTTTIAITITIAVTKPTRLAVKKTAEAMRHHLQLHSGPLDDLVDAAEGVMVLR